MTAIEDNARSIFLAALERTPDQWPALLDKACGGSAELRARVDQLLHDHQAMGSIHGGGPAVPAETIDEPPITERPGTVIGPYKLLEQIGEGGFGVVFMAEQQHPIRRKVALKVLKPGMDTRQVVARFEAERQALALMDHPNIARVIDGGETASGRPYFVMELVRGTPITDFCDQNHLSVRDRLELFIHVCQAVQHAHQKGIIHRDLKPTNVMVAMHDDKPVVKVIDFGIAKAAGQQLTDKTLFTNFAQLIGTPLYMSPEQAGQSSLDADTRSDIYSLGVLLYELLTGTTPFDKERLRTAAYDEMRRIILEEEPPRPSTRMTTQGQAASTASVNRKSDPKRLSQLFRGELDWIVMKCLEKDRNRRYETASTLAADVRRYLSDEPVQACPPSATYRLRKFVRRNRTAVAASVSGVVVLLMAVLGLTISNLRIAQQKAEADANFRKARQAVDEQFTLVSQSKLFEAPGLQPLRKDLLESALNYYLDFLQQRPNDPELQAEIAAAHLRLYQVHEALDGPYSPCAIQQLEKGIEIVEQLVREQGRDGGLYIRLAGFAKGGRSLHGGYSAPTAQPPAFVVIPLFQRIANIWEDFVRDNPAEVGFRNDLSTFYFALQEWQAAIGQPAEALANVRKALDIREKLARQNPNVSEYRAQLAQTHQALGRRLRLPGPPDEVENHFRRALELRQELADEDRNVPNYRLVLAQSHWDLGYWLADTRRPKEAEDAYRNGVILLEELVVEFPQTPDYRRNLATLYEILGHFLRDAGKTDKAENAYREALKNWDMLAVKFPTNVNYRVPYSSFCLCLLLEASHREEEADRIFRKVLEFKPNTPDGQSDLAWALTARPHPRFSDPKRALEMVKKAVAQAPDAGYIWNTLALVQYRNGNWREALVALEKSMQLGSGGDSFDRFFLAMTLWRLGDEEQARKWYSLAVQWMQKNEQHSFTEELRQDLTRFHAEAANLLGIKDQPAVKERQKSNAKAPTPKN